jgi:hypothetical protein
LPLKTDLEIDAGMPLMLPSRVVKSQLDQHVLLFSLVAPEDM